MSDYSPYMHSSQNKESKTTKNNNQNDQISVIFGTSWQNYTKIFPEKYAEVYISSIRIFCILLKLLHCY